MFKGYYIASPSKWCKSTRMKSNGLDILSFEDAKDRCSSDKNCGMFSDVASQHEKYFLCDHEAEILDSPITTTVYLKCTLMKYKIVTSQFFHIN